LTTANAKPCERTSPTPDLRRDKALESTQNHPTSVTINTFATAEAATAQSVVCILQLSESHGRGPAVHRPSMLRRPHHAPALRPHPPPPHAHTGRLTSEGTTDSAAACAHTAHAGTYNRPAPRGRRWRTQQNAGATRRGTRVRMACSKPRATACVPTVQMGAAATSPCGQGERGARVRASHRGAPW